MIRHGEFLNYLSGIVITEDNPTDGGSNNKLNQSETMKPKRFA